MQCFLQYTILMTLKKTAKNCEVEARAVCVLSFTSVGQSTILRNECTIIERLKFKFTANIRFKLRISQNKK